MTGPVGFSLGGLGAPLGALGGLGVAVVVEGGVEAGGASEEGMVELGGRKAKEGREERRGFEG